MAYQRKPIAAAAASAPGRVVLFGDYALMRGQPALAAGVGLYTRCRVRRREGPEFVLKAAGQEATAAMEEVRELGKKLEGLLLTKDPRALREAVAGDYFAAAKYVLGAGFEGVFAQGNEGLEITWESQVPAGVSLGAGASAMVALIGALAAFLKNPPATDQRAAVAHRADQVAHGGAGTSALDTQAAIVGGVIRYIGKGLAERVPCAPGFSLVVGTAAAVADEARDPESHIRQWLAEKPTRTQYFDTIGALTRTAMSIVQRGDWPELGRLMNLHQMVLEKVGVSSPAMERLIDAAWNAGALGAKVTGTGRAMIALATAQTRKLVADAVTAAGGVALLPELPAHGVRIDEES